MRARRAAVITKGIRCNAIYPGHGGKPISSKAAYARRATYDKARRLHPHASPVGRLGTPEEIADLAVYLAGATRLDRAGLSPIDGGMDDLV